jgi:pilus assembly protein CpaC
VEAGKGTLLQLARPASTVFIANPEVADVQVKSPTLIYLNGKAPGETVLYAVDAEDRVLMNSNVRVVHDLSRLRETTRAVAPGRNVKIDSVDNAIVLSGTVGTAAESERLQANATALASETKGSVVNRLSVVTPNQVLLKVKIAEVNRTLLKSLGFNLNKSIINSASGAFSSLGINTNNATTGGQILDVNTFTFGIGGGASRFVATLDALASEGLVTTLAEPNLTAVNGQTASFHAGGEFPVPVAGTASTSAIPTITVAFKKFGVFLDFTPTILDANHLVLRVKPEVSQLSNQGAVSTPISSTQVIQIPALTKRTADTTIELATGESFVLGGLIQNNDTQNISKVPWLGDIPVLGQLFRSEQFQHNETELVMIVTPYLVRPSETALSSPTDGYKAPHDIQRVINGDTYRPALPPPAKGPLPGGSQGLLGPAGFQLD